MKKTKLLILTLFIANFSYAQTALMDSLIQKNYSTFKKNNNNTFEGKGWITLQDEISKNNSVLLGELHFTDEVPYFTNAIINNIKFDNYILEIDPYTINTISTKIKSLSSAELDKFRNESGSALSFYKVKLSLIYSKTYFSRISNYMELIKLVYFQTDYCFRN
ncbi:hypothetical protein [Pedobacter panaciterrae]